MAERCEARLLAGRASRIEGKASRTETAPSRTAGMTGAFRTLEIIRRVQTAVNRKDQSNQVLMLFQHIRSAALQVAVIASIDLDSRARFDELRDHHLETRLECGRFVGCGSRGSLHSG